MQITKLHKVLNEDKEMLAEGIVAFQLVEFKYEFYGRVMVDVLDTKIMSNGDQIVISGNGIIKSGFILPK